MSDRIERCILTVTWTCYLDHNMLVVVPEVQHLFFKLVHSWVTVYVHLALLWKCFADVSIGGDTIEQQPNVEFDVVVVVQVLGLSECRFTARSYVISRSGNGATLRSLNDPQTRPISIQHINCQIPFCC